MCSGTDSYPKGELTMKYMLDDLLFTASTVKFHYIRSEPTLSEITVYAADVIDKTLFLNAHLPLIPDLVNVGPFVMGGEPKLLEFIRKQIVNGDGDLSISPGNDSLVLTQSGLVSKYYKFLGPMMAPKCSLKSTPRWSHLLTISPNSPALTAIVRTMSLMKSFCHNQFYIKVADGFLIIELLAKFGCAANGLGDTGSIFRLCHTGLPDHPPIMYPINKFLEVVKASRNDNIMVSISPTTRLMQCSFSRNVAGDIVTYDFLFPGQPA